VIRVLVRCNKSDQGAGPTVLRQQEWIFELEADKETTDSVNMTIDKQPSGRDQAAGPPERETTQEADEIWTVPLWPFSMKNKIWTVPLWPSETRTDSAYKAIGMIREPIDIGSAGVYAKKKKNDDRGSPK
jgi:hypothetical protein